MGMRDKKWFVDHLPADGSAQLADLTSALYTVGVWGPRARDLVQSVARDDLSERGVPVRDGPQRRHRRRPHADVADLLRRRARLGDLLPDGAGPAPVGHALGGRPAARRRRRSGSASTPRPAGSRRAIERTARSSSSSSTWSRPGWPVRRSRTPTSSARPPISTSASQPPAAILCTLTVDDPTSAERGQALHARPRADPVRRRPAARRRQGPPLVRDERRLRAVARQAPPHELPPARQAAVEGTGSSSSTSASATR